MRDTIYILMQQPAIIVQLNFVLCVKIKIFAINVYKT